MESNFKKISAMLSQRAEEVTSYLLPKGKREGNEWRVGSIGGEEGKSLGVHLVGEKSGVWSDFATGDSGDLLDLWRLTRKISLKEALADAQKYLGIDQPTFEESKQKKFSRPPVEKANPINSLQSPALQYLTTERKLSFDTVKEFKVGERKQEIIFNYFRDDDLIFIKYLSLERGCSESQPNGKKRMYIESNCEPCLFGWQALSTSTRKVALTEGEIDAMSLHQYGVSALSVPFGGGGGKKHEWVENEFDRLAVFDEIFLCLDNDKEGQIAISELVMRLGRYRCRIVKLPYKDANECLQKGVSKEEIEKCFDNARTLDPEELKAAHLFVDDVIKEFYPPQGQQAGIASPWEKVKDKVLFRPEELSVWSGINGHGKSQFLGHIMLHSMKQGARVCIASLEIKPKKLLMRLTRQASGCIEPTENYIRAIHDWYADKLWLFNLTGTAKRDRLLDVFLYAKQRYGVEIFVIDSLMMLDIADDDYKSQKEFIGQLCDFKNQHNCHIHLIVHPRKADDESKLPGKLDIKGGGSISDQADNCFTVWRNKAKEEIAQLQANGVTLSLDQTKKLEECDCIWRCDKQRNGEWEGKIMLWFDPKSFQYLSHPQQKIMQYVEFSMVSS